MFQDGKTGLATYVPDSLQSCLSYFGNFDSQIVLIGLLVTIPLIFGLSYLLDSLGEACGNKANAEGCGTVQRYLFSFLTAIMTVVSLPFTLLVVVLSLVIAAVIVAGYILSYPLSMLRRILIMFLRKISPMSIQDMLETYTGKLLCAGSGGCPSGVVQVEGKNESGGGASGGRGGRSNGGSANGAGGGMVEGGASGDNGAEESEYEDEEDC